MPAVTWDPSLYLRFNDHRARPFHDLVGRIGARAPRTVVDLGCGPGHLTGLLAARWPGATVIGLDSAPEMVAAARDRGVDARLADVADWMPSADTDVVVTNAVLQWVPAHRELLARWIGALPADAWFAMQVPGNFAAPSHTLVRELAAEWDRVPAPSGAATLASREEDAVDAPATYAELLAGAGAEVDVWETTYLHRLSGQDPVLRWISGTVLRPVRDSLGPADYARFEAELAPRLRRAYPARADGTTWFPFRRVFAVARATR